MPDTAPKFAPTAKRGTELLRHVMDIIEAEAEAAANVTEQDTRVGHWNQGDWIRLRADELAEDLDLRALAVEAAGAKSFDELGTDPGHLGVSVPINPETGLLDLCGTACCFAGHASLQVGDYPVLTTNAATLYNITAPGADQIMEMGLNLVIPIETVAESGGAPLTTLPYESVSGRAQELLGLSGSDADTLFDGSNTLADLRELVARLERGEEIDNLKCTACDEYPWNCNGGEVCDTCNEHEDHCLCDICEVCDRNVDAGNCWCETCDECGSRVIETTQDEDTLNDLCDDCHDRAEAEREERRVAEEADDEEDDDE
ncbi:hypothetical protein SEA_MARIOKART_72 [Gordonia phage Mariokart]|nr:hypothetical protein SEA_MARIOKART_72 [Gordonia phage Mariokart]